MHRRGTTHVKICYDWCVCCCWLHVLDTHVCTHMHTRTHVRTHTHACTHSHICKCTHTHIIIIRLSMHAHMHAHTHTHTHTHTHAHTFVQSTLYNRDSEGMWRYLYSNLSFDCPSALAVPCCDLKPDSGHSSVCRKSDGITCLPVLP